jgi:hypothetical protein
VREERLRATAGLRSSSTLSSWRGRSGRRYIVGVHPLNEAELLEVTDAVILAVKRDRTGNGIVVDAAMAATGASAKVRGLGATELHIHRLAATEDDRRAIFEDLRENETQDS